MVTTLDKTKFRAEAKTLRAGVDAQMRERCASSVSERLVELLSDAGTVMAFLSFGTELPTDGIIEALHAAGHAIVLPHVAGEDVVPVSYAPGDPVETATFGIREPTTRLPVDLATIDAVLVPGLSFDRTGHRVGYGGGFYDRFLPTLRPETRTIGICMSIQLADYSVPKDEYDVPVTTIVTERQVIQTGHDPQAAG